MAVAALVVGIISLLGVFCWGVGGIVLGLVAVVLGVLGMRKSKELPGEPQKGLAIGGIVTGALGLLGGLVFLVLTVFLVSTADDLESDFGDINSDPSDGVCDESRFLQDPDC